MTTKHDVEFLPHEEPLKNYILALRQLRDQVSNDPSFQEEIKDLEDKIEGLKEKIYTNLSPFQRILIARHSSRPQTEDYVKNIFSDFHPIRGDRAIGDDESILAGFASIGNMKCVVIGQQRGSDTESRIRYNFGMVKPEGFRKALRAMHLAEKFNIPVITLLDTPGAQPSLEAEEKGQGWVIAKNLFEMARLKVPILTVLIGEAWSGGALGIGMGDYVAMLEHACYSVISPEGCASILWKDAKKKEEAAEALKMNAEDLLELGVIDEVIPEPLGGAHYDPGFVYEKVQALITTQLSNLLKIPEDLLIERRYQKYRKYGEFFETNPQEL